MTARRTATVTATVLTGVLLTGSPTTALARVAPDDLSGAASRTAADTAAANHLSLRHFSGTATAPTAWKAQGNRVAAVLQG